MQVTPPQQLAAALQAPTPRAAALAITAAEAAEAGQLEAAAVGFTAAVEADPIAPALREQLAQVLLTLGRERQGAFHAEAAVALAPSWPAAWLTLGRCLLNAGEPRAAAAALARGTVLDPACSSLRAELAEARMLAAAALGRAVGLPDLAVSHEEGGELGPGCTEWAAGVALARALVSWSRLAAAGGMLPPAGWPPLLLKGAKLLEVGAGAGLVGLTAACLGARVTLTDLPALQPLLSANIDANTELVHCSGGAATAAVLDWDDVQVCDTPGLGLACCTTGFGAASVTHHDHLDWCLGADLVYAQRQVTPVVRLLARLLLHSGNRPPPQPPCTQSTDTVAPGDSKCACTVVASKPPRGFLMAHKHRNDAVDGALLAALGAAGLSLAPVPLVCEDGGQEPRGITAWWITTSAMSPPKD
jgi:Lysine methyltransferase/Tetratricopeptide repeat